MRAFIYAPIPTKYHKFFPRLRGGDDDSPPHITILYVGQVSKDDVKVIDSVMQEFAKEFPSIKCEFGEVKSFPAGEYGVPWYVDIKAEPLLEKLHKRLWQALEEGGVVVEHSWPDFNPHATLKYLPEGEEYEGDTPEGSFSIDQIVVDVAE